MLSLPKSQNLRQRLASAGVIVWLACGIVVLGATLQSVLEPRPLRGAAAANALRRDSVGAPADSTLPRYVSEAAIKTGDEVALVFVGASFCGAHNVPGFPQVVERAKIAVQRRAKGAGKQFRAVGVALDWRPAEGIAFLSRFGEFDEISAGSNWVGDAATRYVWRDLSGSAEVPQLLIVSRHVDAEADQAIRMTGDRVVRRLLGTKAIEAWVAQGAPI